MDKVISLTEQKQKTQEQLNPINKELTVIHKEILQKLETEKIPEITIGKKVYSLEKKQRKLNKKELFTVIETILKTQNKTSDEKIEAIVRSMKSKIDDGTKNKLIVKAIN
jgi:hypothetical protein